MALKSGIAFCLAVSLVCGVVNCRPLDDGVKPVKGAKVRPPAFIDGGSFKLGPVPSSDAGSISSSSGEHGSLTQADFSSMLSSESGFFTSEDPSESSENVGGLSESYSGQLGSSSHLDSAETLPGIHTISGNTEHGGSGVAETHGLGGSRDKNVGTAQADRVSRSNGHEGSTKTGVRKLGTNVRCSSDRTVGNVGETGDDERRGHGAASDNGAHGFGDSDADKSGGLAENVSGHKNIITVTDGVVLGGAHGGSSDGPEEFQTTDPGVLDGSTHGFGIVDSTDEQISTFSESFSEAYSGSSTVSEVDSVNSSDSSSHVDPGSQPGVSDSGSSTSSPDSSSGSQVNGRKKLPFGVKG